MAHFKPIYPHEATPLDPDEIKDLIPDYITTQKELNILEHKNITEAAKWAYCKKHSDILNITFNNSLHKKMFYQVWKWAGIQRKTNKNIGVDFSQIPMNLKNLFEDTKYQIKNKTYKWDELAIRFHYRLVFIHAFPNGNGRHARLMTDILLKVNDQEPFTWGEKFYHSSIDTESKVRKLYLAALRKADSRSFSELITFARK